MSGFLSLRMSEKTKTAILWVYWILLGILVLNRISEGEFASAAICLVVGIVILVFFGSMVGLDR